MQVTVSLDKIHSAKRVLLTAGAVLAFITLFALFGLIFYQLFKPGSQQQNNVHFGPPNHHHQHQHQSRAVPGGLRPSLPPSTLKSRKNSSPTTTTSTTTPPPTTSPQSLPQQAQTGPDSLSDWSTFQRLWHAEGEAERAKVLVQNVNLNSNSTWSGKVNKYTIGLKPLSEMVNFTENFDPLNTTFMMDPERLKRIELYIQKNFFPLYDRHLLELEELTASGPPERFNGAQRWPECAHSILRVRDQGGCGSCWAVAAISVISDRICIASKGRHREGVSAQQLVECCDYCGGCTGAPNSFFPFLFWHQQGLVSDQCFPYTIARDCGYPCPPSEFHHPRGLGNCTLGTHSCADPSHRPKRQRAKYVYKLGSLDEEEVNFFPESLHHRLRRNHSGLFEGTKIRDAVDLLKRELMAHGPVMLCFSVFEGFMHFHDGVYNFDLQPGELHVYDHCVKVIGWGRQRRPNVAGVQRYLLAVNSWSRNWAKDGTFKIDLDRLSHFHSDLFAGMPQL